MRQYLGTFARVMMISALMLPMTGCDVARHNPSLGNQTNIENGTAGFSAGVVDELSAKGRIGLVEIIRVDSPTNGVVQIVTRPVSSHSYGERILDLASPDGLTNYIASTFPNARIHRVIVTNSALVPFVRANVSSRNHVSTSVNASSRTYSIGHTIAVPPPGVVLDHRIQPIANKSADENAKADAVLSVATSKLGAPFVWGHNEDRGQNGFDSSNFVAYVYHHALGYEFSGNSVTQWDTVGMAVPIWDRRPGDLLIFDHGRQVAIYAGDDEMLMCGGGTGKVTRQSLGPESTFAQELSGVRRMF